MQEPVSAEDRYEEIRKLIDRNRARCLWFAPVDYQPTTNAERLRALKYVEKRGDREAFIQARELSQWLLLHFRKQ